jgi:dTDP-4-dehydrorhamnose 3,5-epimerase
MASSKWAFEPLALSGAYLITPFAQEDERGEFAKDYAESVFRRHGIECPLKETFYSISHPNVVRGMHFQSGKPQAKLVRCISGSIYDVIVDIRVGSPTLGKWLGFRLNDENRLSLYVPQGFAHGFMAIMKSIVSYKCDEEFFPAGDDGIRYNDADLDIRWPETAWIIQSQKDRQLQTFSEYLYKINTGGGGN